MSDDRQHMSDSATRLKQAVDRMRRAHRREAVKLAMVRTAATALLLGLAVLCVDVWLAWEDGPRFAVDLAFIAVLLVVAAATYFRQTRAVSVERRVARLMEQSHPELGNDLVNALDFEERLEAGPPPDLSRDLMQAEIDRAGEAVSALTDTAPLRPLTLRRERRIAFAALGAWIAASLVFPGVVRAVLPRYFDPAGDHPPYSATRLELEPAAARVHYGEDVRIVVRADGTPPEKVWLVLRDDEGREMASLPMLSVAEGEYHRTLEGVKEDGRYFARMSRGRSTRHPLTVIRTPRIESASATYTYPDYTGKGEEMRTLSEPRVLRGYAGTAVEVTVTSNRPLKGGTLTVSGRDYPFEPAGPRAVRAVFSLDDAGEFRGRIADVDGVENREPFEGKVEIVSDNKPSVAITRPGMDAFAVPDAKVTLAIEAADDLGIRDVTLYRNFNGSKDAEKAVYTAASAEPFAHAVEVLDLADLGVRPGDVIDYYATATDNRPEAPQTAASPAFRLKIVSFEEYRDFMQTRLTAEDLTRKYAEIGDRLDAVAQEQERLQEEAARLVEDIEKSGAPGAAARQALEEVLEAQAALAEETEKLAEQLREESRKPGVFDIERDFKEALSDVARKLEESARAMREGEAGMRRAQQEAPGRPEAARQALADASARQQRARDALGRGNEQLHKGILEPGRELESVYALMQDVETFKDLYTRQKGLERQAHSLQDAPASDLDQRIRMKEIAEEQQSLRENLDRLAQDLEEHARGLGDTYPKVAEDARNIADEMERRGIAETMDRAAESLARGEGRGGHGAARSARQQMEEMISFCEAASGAGRAECEARLNIQMPRGLGDTLGQLSRSLGSGVSSGMGPAGSGVSGAEGGSTPFGMFGNETFGDKSREPGGRVRHRADSLARPAEPSDRAVPFQERVEPKALDRAYETGGGERFIDEYRGLIDEYFRGLAEEKP